VGKIKEMAIEEEMKIDDEIRRKKGLIFDQACEMVDKIKDEIEHTKLDGICLITDEFRRDHDGMQSGEVLLQNYIAELLTSNTVYK